MKLDLASGVNIEIKNIIMSLGLVGKKNRNDQRDF